MILKPTEDMTATARIIAAYTELGIFTPRRTPKVIPLAVRERHEGRHHADRRSAPVKWAVSKLRDLGDSLWGSFLRTAE